MEDMLSADDVSCSSSQVSAKSEKNMADFDGEESGCEEELVQINSHAELSSHLQQHLPNLASIYHEHLVQGTYTHTAFTLTYTHVQQYMQTHTISCTYTLTHKCSLQVHMRMDTHTYTRNYTCVELTLPQHLPKTANNQFYI